VLAQPGLDLVGAFAWNSEKAGIDLRELCNLELLGVTTGENVQCKQVVKVIAPRIVTECDLRRDPTLASQLA
jgi:hypothetical protein